MAGHRQRIVAGTLLKPRALEPQREPGPFSLSRYAQDRGRFPTFFNLPVAITLEDLKAGAVDTAMVGIPLNMGSGTRGAQLCKAAGAARFCVTSSNAPC